MSDIPDSQPSISLSRRWARWLSDREVQFWSVQLVGWTSWAFASAIGWVYWMDKPDRPHIVALYALVTGAIVI